MQSLLERVFIIYSFLILLIFLFIEGLIVLEGGGYDIPSYLFYYDLFVEHGLFEKVGIGVPDLNWISMFPIVSLLFFYPLYAIFNDVFLATTFEYVLLSVLSIISFSLLILKRTKEPVAFLQYLLYFFIFIQFPIFSLGRITELQIVFLASLFFLIEKKEKVFLIPLMFFTNPTIAFPYILLFSYISFKEKNFLFIPALLISFFAILPFLHSFFYPNISSVLSRCEEGTFNIFMLIPIFVLLFFSRKPWLSFLSGIFLFLVFTGSNFKIFNLNILENLPILGEIFLVTWSCFFVLLGILFVSPRKFFIPFLILLSFVGIIMQGFIPQEDEADIHDVLKGFKCIFLAVDDDILAIETRRTSIAYLNGYDVDITPMYWFADKRYISEFENNLRRGDCKSIPFLKSRDFDKIVITDSSESRIIVENYLNECNLSYIVVERGGNYSPFYVIDISSFN